MTTSQLLSGFLVELKTYFNMIGNPTTEADRLASKRLTETLLTHKDQPIAQISAYLSKMEIPGSGPTATYASLVLEQMKRDLAEWKNDTLEEFVAGLNRLWIGAKLLEKILDESKLAPPKS